MKQLPLCAVAAIWLAVANLAGQSGTQVGGIVRSATTGEGLKGAVVTLRLQGSERRVARTTAGVDGSFGLSGLSPGQYQLTISKSGYRTFQGNSPISVLEGGAEPARLAPLLWPYGVIGGHVVDWEGEPVSRAEARAYAVIYELTGTRLSLTARADANDLGEYRLFGLPAGKYMVQVSPPRTETPSGQFYADTPAAYYPSAPTPAQALPIELKWGEEATGTDVSISRGQSYAIAGAAWDALAEGPCRRCLVEAVQRDNLYSVTLPQVARVSREGVFVLRGLVSGDYTLVVRRGSSRSTVGQTQASIRGAHVEDARLIAGLQQPVTGQIILENPPEGIEGTDWTPQLLPIGLPQWWPRVEGTVDADRQFTIDGAPPARYRFELSDLPAGAYLKALRSGGQRLGSVEILVTPDSAVTGLQAVIGFDGATIHGKVQSPGSAEKVQFVQARVFLLPQQNQAGFHVPKIAETASDGSFNLASVAPGSYTLYALPVAASLQIFDPAVQAALARYATRVSLDPKQTAEVEVALAPQVR